MNEYGKIKGKKWRTLRKTYPFGALCPTNPTLTSLISKPALRGGSRTTHYIRNEGTI